MFALKKLSGNTISSFVGSSRKALIIIILTIGISQLIHNYQSALDTATERANSRSFLVAEWVDKSFDLTKFVLRETAKNFDPSELVYPTPDPERHQQQTEELIDTVSRTPNLVFLGMLDDQCIVTHTTIGINLGFDGIEHQREYCKLALSEPLSGYKLSNMFVSVDNTMNVTMSYPLLSDDGTLQGFALAGLDLGFFQQWLDLIELDNHNSITIYDLNSRMLARNPLIVSSIGTQVTEQHLNRMASSTSERLFSHRLASPVDNIDRVWSLRRIGYLPFIVVVGEATNHALQNWQQLLILYIFAGLTLCAAILFATYEYIRNLRQAMTMRHLAITDPLTGVANRRYFNEVASLNIARNARNGLPLSLLILDLDHFKKVNDIHGHATGDRVLVDIANMLQSLCRETDVIARWGGEEFTLLLPDTDQKGATTFAQRLADSLSTYRFIDDKTITISQGIATYQPGDTIESLLKRADKALYQAKEKGRNRFELG